MSQKPAPVRGWITPAICSIVSFCSLGGRCILPNAELPDGISDSDASKVSERRAKKVDTFVFCCLVVETIALLIEGTVHQAILRDICVALVSWRIVDVVAADIKMCIFDPFDQSTFKAERIRRFVPTTPSRVIILGIINYTELFLSFATIYCFDNKLIAQTSTNLGWASGSCGVLERALHLSIVTQLTIGFGDLAPTGWIRPVVWAQGGAGLALIALFITRYMSLLPEVP